ncbi:MFS transporter [Pseudomaricurvus alkylphenolicus]|uniref:MFS transporter n=1 Tax=Pseudomaricurvus alkylphenolicus TaxID=1306991 RepID=UPI001424A690|nr:MFS transporter [Pseudomaricurvus alkylphenolicus]
MSSAETINRPSVMVASTLYIGVAFLVYNMLPIVLKSAGDSLGINEQQIGYLGSIYMAGSAISNIVAVFWVRRLNWRTTVFCTSLLAAVCYFFAGTADYSSLLVLFLVIGLANSAIVSCVFTCMGDTRNPDRAFGYGIGSQVTLAGIGAFCLPVFIIPSWQFQGVALFLCACALLTLPLAKWMPAGGAKSIVVDTHTAAKNAVSRISPLTTMLWGFVGLFIYFAGQSGIWAFFGQIGGEGGLSDQQLGLIFGPTLIFSAVGGFLSGWFSKRYDRRFLITGAIALGIVSLLILLTPFGINFWMFSLAVLLYCISWNFVMPFFMTIIIEGDISGRFAPLVPACQLFGSVVGPAASGHLIFDGSYLYVYLFAIASVSLCAFIFVTLDTLSGRSEPDVLSGAELEAQSG